MSGAYWECSQCVYATNSEEKAQAHEEIREHKVFQTETETEDE